MENRALVESKIVAELKIAYDAADYGKQVVEFIELGDNFRQKRDLINAAAIYQFALAICLDAEKNKKFKEKIESYQDFINKNLVAVERQLQASFGKETKLSDEELIRKHQKHKEALSSIRTWAKEQLDLISKKNTSVLSRSELKRNSSDRDQKEKEAQSQTECRTDPIQEIYQGVSACLRNFVKDLIVECKTVLGEPPDQPCSYAFICFGSLARDEATPYSDLEFGVLLEEKANTEKNKEYFRHLTRLLQFNVINLGETTARMQDIRALEPLRLLDRYSESPTKHGFCFDGQGRSGCVTPLGNRLYRDVAEEEQYELILTPMQMAQFQSKGFYQRNRHLTTALSIAEFVEGNDKNLLDIYRASMANVLKETVVTKTPVIKEVKVTLAQKRALDLLRECVDNFEPTLGLHGEEGHFFNVKYDFYRLPSMLVCHLATYHGINLNNGWQQIEALHERSIVSHEARAHLIRTFSKVAEMRLRAYLMHGCQDNQVVSKDQDPKRARELLARSFLVTWEELNEIYYVLMPLSNSVRSFLENLNVTNEGLKCYDNGSAVKAEICFQLLDYNGSNRFFEEELKGCELDPTQFILRATRLNNIAYNCYFLSQNNAAIKYLEESLQIRESKLGPAHPRTLQSRVNLAAIYLQKADYLRAAQHLDSAIGELKSDEHNPELAKAFFHKGKLFVAQRGYYKDAIDCYENAVRIMKFNYGEESTYTATVVAELGECYRLDGKIDQALQCLNKALTIFKGKHGAYHPYVATILTNVGCVFSSKDEFDKAIEYHKKALDIYKVILQNTHNDDSVVALYNLAGAYIKKAYKGNGNYEDAVKVYQEILEASKRMSGDGRHHVASCYRTLGNLYKRLMLEGRLNNRSAENDPLLLLNQALSVYQAIDLECLEVGFTYNDLGDLFFMLLLQLDVAIDYYNRAISIYEKKFSGNSQYMTSVLSNLVHAYEDSNNYLNAIKALKKIYNVELKQQMIHYTHRFILQYNQLVSHSPKSALNNLESDIHEVLSIARELLGEQHDFSKRLNQLKSDCRRRASLPDEKSKSDSSYSTIFRNKKLWVTVGLFSAGFFAYRNRAGVQKALESSMAFLFRTK